MLCSPPVVGWSVPPSLLLCFPYKRGFCSLEAAGEGASVRRHGWSWDPAWRAIRGEKLHLKSVS